MKKNKTKNVRVTHSVSQKIWGALALAALFVCGIMVGVSVGDKKIKQQDSVLDQTTQELQQSEQKETCAVIEEIQLRWLADEMISDVDAHNANIRIYETLFQYGCPENKQKYRDAIAREMQIVDSLSVGYYNDASTCEQIEASLLGRLPDGTVYSGADERIERAKIYANLSERGCPENKEKYVALATQELEIARALEDDEFSNDETIEVVETYKRLNMQAAAQEVFDMAKKLTDPAIDFIIEVEKIINQ